MNEAMGSVNTEKKAYWDRLGRRFCVYPRISVYFVTTIRLYLVKQDSRIQMRVLLFHIIMSRKQCQAETHILLDKYNFRVAQRTRRSPWTGPCLTISWSMAKSFRYNYPVKIFIKISSVHDRENKCDTIISLIILMEKEQYNLLISIRSRHL